MRLAALVITWRDIVVVCGSLTVVLGFLTAFWRYIGRPATRSLRAADKLIELEPKLSKLASEFEPNGGASIKDRVDGTMRSCEAAEESAAKAADNARLAVAETREVRDHLITLETYTRTRFDDLQRFMQMLTARTFQTRSDDEGNVTVNGER